MDSSMGSQGTVRSRRSWQVSLADLCFLVLAAGLASGVVRGAREVWGTGLGQWGTWLFWDPIGRTVGLAVEVASIWLALILVRDILRQVRGHRSGMGSGSGRAPGDDGLARPCDRAPAGLHHAGVASPRGGLRDVSGPRRRARRDLSGERDARPHLRDPDNHRRRTRHGRRDEPAASVSGTGAALLAVRPAGRPGRRLVHGTTGRLVVAHPATSS